MHPLLIKLYFSFSDWLGRTLIFNTNPPPVGRFIFDVPYGNDPDKQSLDILVPTGSEVHPILVYIHGGGWLSGNKKNCRRLCRSFAAAGYLVFNINYRLAPKHPFPAPLQDAAAALGWIVRHAEEYGGDPARIFLAGDSAGAHLASLLTADSSDRERFQKFEIPETIHLGHIKGLLLFYGAYDLEAGSSRFPFAATILQSLLGPTASHHENLAHLISPINHLGPHFPPIFLCCGELDLLYSQSQVFAEACKTKGSNLEILFFPAKEHPEAFHSFMNWYFLKSTRIALNRALAFMARNSG